MKRRIVLATIVMAAILVSVLGVSALMGGIDASADDSDQQRFRWLAGAGDFGGGLLCDFPPGCPDQATAASGDTIEIVGEGTLAINEDGDPKDVDGGGSYTQGSASGTWEAKRLIMFDSYGPGTIFWILLKIVSTLPGFSLFQSLNICLIFCRCRLSCEPHKVQGIMGKSFSSAYALISSSAQ